MRLLRLPGSKRIEPVRQNEAAECGLAALAMVANWHGHDVDLAMLRQRFAVSARGMTLRQLMQTADGMQLLARPLKLDLGGLALLNLPAILHWDLNHFVVVERVAEKRAYIVDRQAARAGTISTSWDGISAGSRWNCGPHKTSHPCARGRS